MLVRDVVFASDDKWSKIIDGIEVTKENMYEIDKKRGIDYQFRVRTCQSNRIYTDIRKFLYCKVEGCEPTMDVHKNYLGAPESAYPALNLYIGTDELKKAQDAYKNKEMYKGE